MSNAKLITLNLLLFLGLATLSARSGFAYDLGIPYVTPDGDLGVGLGLGAGVDFTGDHAGQVRVGGYTLGPWRYSGFDPEEFKKFMRGRRLPAPSSHRSSGSTPIVSQKVIAPGAICPQGGVELSAGVDVDSNSILSKSEMGPPRVFCGQDVDLLHITFGKIPAFYSKKCILGGEEAHLWNDANRDGKMDAGEELWSPAWCNTLSGLLNPAPAQVGTGPTPVNPSAVSGRVKGAHGEQESGRKDTHTLDAGVAQ